MGYFWKLKVTTDSCLVSQEFEFSAAKDLPCKGGRYTLNLLKAHAYSHWCGVEAIRGSSSSGVSSSLDHGSKLRYLSPKALV
ncbi:hypothetical protein TNCV_4931631 [Trichonephila clavipes]|nr:hypothetical protein TNCV_4931631 [Trichonephila clavipes]